MRNCRSVALHVFTEILCFDYLQLQHHRLNMVSAVRKEYCCGWLLLELNRSASYRNKGVLSILDLYYVFLLQLVCLYLEDRLSHLTKSAALESINHL